jgi:hypothetical protein
MTLSLLAESFLLMSLSSLVLLFSLSLLIVSLIQLIKTIKMILNNPDLLYEVKEEKNLTRS